MTARELVEYAGRLFGIERRTLRERAGSLLEMAGLSDVRTKVGGFSRGMRQRLGIAQALINAPSVLLLDEPTSALDPVGRRDVLEMIASLRGRTTVFFSTHILADVERVCDTVAILDRGRVVANAPIAEIKRRAAVDRLVVEVDGDPAMLIREIERRPWEGPHAAADECLLAGGDGVGRGRTVRVGCGAAVRETGTLEVRCRASRMRHGSRSLGLETAV